MSCRYASSSESQNNAAEEPPTTSARVIGKHRSMQKADTAAACTPNKEPNTAVRIRKELLRLIDEVNDT